ncbi:MAG: DUF559 domain-containing protein [Fimbriimonadaceae bacterium]|nr:MAG: DUF559 domain-containing protein [Fimbriimonadaceae bacterium]
MVWQEVRKLRELGIRVRRQYAIENYIADFACIKARIVIEIDGQSHDDSRLLHDEERQSILEGLGWRVLRFSNIEALENPSRIAQIIYESSDQPHP